VNPLLGTTQAISEYRHQPGSKHELSPEILRTCRQIYNEASEVLYGANKLIIACRSHAKGWGDVDLCPLTRRLNHQIHFNRNNSRIDELDNFFRLEQISGFAKVKDSKAIVSQVSGREYNSNDDPRWDMGDFCRAICQTPTRSLEI